MKVTITTVYGIVIEYNVNNFDDLINKLKKKCELFCLIYDDTMVFNSLKDNINYHDLKNNDNYNIVYLSDDSDLIIRTIKVTVTITSGNSTEYNVNNFDDLINELNKTKRFFCLIHGETMVYHSLEDNKNNHDLNDAYTMVYLLYNEDLIVRILEMKCNFYYFTKKLLKDISTLFKNETMYNDPIFLVFLARHLSFDADFQLFSFISDDIKNNSDVMMKLVLQKYCLLEYASDELKNNREFILKVVKQRGSALDHTSEELKNDREIVLEAVKQYYGAFEYVPEYLKKDKEIILEAVKKNGSALKYASDDLRNDKDIVLISINQCGLSLQYASEDLQNNKKIVLYAVKNDGLALEHASNNLKNDKEIVLEAVKQNGYALIHASNNLKKDKDCIKSRRLEMY